MTDDAPEVLCQVCGAPLDGPLLWCRHCDTPHHADCWQFNGGCSTFGCGSKRARGTPPTGRGNADDEPLLLTIEDDGATDESEGPLLVIDDAAPTPSGPGPATQPSTPDAALALRATCSFALQLPVAVVRRLLRTAELLCWPGWALASLAFERADARYPPAQDTSLSETIRMWLSKRTLTVAGDGTLVGRFTEWLFGTRTLHVTRSILLGGLAYALSAELVKFGGPPVFMVPLGAYVLLAPPLKRLLAGLAGLLPPPPEEPEHLPAIARDAVLFALHLPRRVARLTLLAGEVACWPGWAAAAVAYEAAADMGKPGRNSSLVSTAIRWVFGETVLRAGRTILIWFVLWLMACGLVRDRYAAAVALGPLTAYMLLAPPLKLVFSALQDLFLSPVAEPVLLATAPRQSSPATSSRSRRRRRNRKRRSSR